MMYLKHILNMLKNVNMNKKGYNSSQRCGLLGGDIGVRIKSRRSQKQRRKTRRKGGCYNG